MKIISHRGANRELPENTMAAFKRALEIGVDGLETDLQLTKDGELILCHDDTIFFQGKKQRIENLSLAEIKKIDLGKGLNVPTFEDFFGEFSSRVALLLDIKSKGAGAVLADRLRSKKHLDRIHVSSFHESEIIAVKEKIPEISLALIFSALPKDVATRCGRLGVKELSLARESLTRDQVQELLNLKIITAVYTVNSLEDARKLESWGVRAIFTDDPAVMQPLRDK